MSEPTAPQGDVPPAPGAAGPAAGQPLPRPMWDPRDPRGRAQPARPRVPLAVFALLGCVLLGGCLLFGMVSLLGGAGSVALGGGHQGPLHEETVVDGTSDAKVVLLQVEGVIAAQQGGGLFGGGVDLVERVRRELEAAAKDDGVRALLVSIDSPGGTVTASDQVWHLIQQWKKKTNRPVVVHMGALCASGGYYIAVAGDELICEPTTITGSIGVVLSGMNFHGLMEKYGVKGVTITSGDNKDLLNPFEEVRQGHVDIIRSMVDETYARFVKLVAQGRGLPEADVRALADGRIYTADQALKLKLVDAIGYREDALARAASRAGTTNPKLVRYTRPPTLADVLAGTARAPLGGGGGVQVQLDPAALERFTTPRLLALWQGAR